MVYAKCESVTEVIFYQTRLINALAKVDLDGFPQTFEMSNEKFLMGISDQLQHGGEQLTTEAARSRLRAIQPWLMTANDADFRVLAQRAVGLTKAEQTRLVSVLTRIRIPGKAPVDALVAVGPQALDGGEAPVAQQLEQQAGEIPAAQQLEQQAGEIPAAQQLEQQAGEIPAAQQLEQQAGEIPAAQQLEQQAGEIPAAQQLEQQAGEIPAAQQLEQQAGEIPAAQQLEQQAGEIPAAQQLEQQAGEIPVAQEPFSLNPRYLLSVMYYYLAHIFWFFMRPILRYLLKYGVWQMLSQLLWHALDDILPDWP